MEATFPISSSKFSFLEVADAALSALHKFPTQKSACNFFFFLDFGFNQKIYKSDIPSTTMHKIARGL